MAGLATDGANSLYVGPGAGGGGGLGQLLQQQVDQLDVQGLGDEGG